MDGGNLLRKEFQVYQKSIYYLICLYYTYTNIQNTTGTLINKGTDIISGWPHGTGV